MRLTTTVLTLTLLLPSLSAAEVYLEPATFVQQAFEGAPPKPKLLWLTGDVAQAHSAVTGEKPNRLRIRYWRRGARSVWVLERIGKEKPITAGFVIDDNTIAEVRVLAFRESRGWEIRYPFFTKRFKGSGLNDEQSLDRTIDSITGATLSVRAMERMAALALLYHRASGSPK